MSAVRFSFSKPSVVFTIPFHISIFIKDFQYTIIVQLHAFSFIYCIRSPSGIWRCFVEHQVTIILQDEELFFVVLEFSFLSGNFFVVLALGEDGDFAIPFVLDIWFFVLTSEDGLSGIEGHSLLDYRGNDSGVEWILVFNSTCIPHGRISIIIVHKVTIHLLDQIQVVAIAITYYLYFLFINVVPD